MSNPNLIYLLYAIGFFGFLILSEFLFGIYKKNNTYKNVKDAASSLIQGGTYLLFQIPVIGFFLSINLFLYEFRIFTFGNAWYEIFLCYIVMDFSYYWWHRASHRIRFLWANHIIHHTSEEMNFTTALRQTFMTPFLRPFFYLHLPLLGFHPELLGILGGIGLLSAIWTHTKLIGKLGFLEKIIVTPAGHRVHHGSNPEYIDKNYGGTFMIWDVIFGTYQAEVTEVRYGITTNINTYNPIKIATHEYVSWIKDLFRSESLSKALKFTFYGPEKIEELRQIKTTK